MICTRKIPRKRCIREPRKMQIIINYPTHGKKDASPKA